MVDKTCAWIAIQKPARLGRNLPIKVMVPGNRLRKLLEFLKISPLIQKVIYNVPHATTLMGSMMVDLKKALFYLEPPIKIRTCV